jgi:hypothetical protein
MSYLPGLLDHAPLHHHQPARTTVQALRDAGFSQVEHRAIHYADADDGSFQALKHQPELLLDDEQILNTAVLMRVPEQERREASETIRSDYKSGRQRAVMAPAAMRAGGRSDFGRLNRFGTVGRQAQDERGGERDTSA